MNLALKLTLVPIALMQTLYIAGKSNIKCMAAKRCNTTTETNATPIAFPQPKVSANMPQADAADRWLQLRRWPTLRTKARCAGHSDNIPENR